MLKEDNFVYIWILVFSFWFYNNAYFPDISFIVSILTAVVIVYYLNNKKETTISDLNTSLHYKLTSLLEEEMVEEPESLYLEPDMINFFYDIRDFRIYNRDAYLKCITNVDNVLKVKKELEYDYKYITPSKLSGWQIFGNTEKQTIQRNIKNHPELFKKARKSANLAINYLHSFIISLPGEVYKEKHKTSVKIFHIYIKRLLDEILIVCKKSSSDLLIGKDYGIPRASDPELGSFDFFNL